MVCVLVDRSGTVAASKVLNVFSLSGAAIDGTSHRCVGCTRGDKRYRAISFSLPGSFVMGMANNGEGMCVSPFSADAIFGELGRSWGFGWVLFKLYVASKNFMYSTGAAGAWAEGEAAEW